MLLHCTSIFLLELAAEHIVVVAIVVVVVVTVAVVAFSTCTSLAGKRNRSLCLSASHPLCIFPCCGPVGFEPQTLDALPLSLSLYLPFSLALPPFASPH